MTNIKKLLAAIIASLLIASPVVASTWTDGGIQWRTRTPFTLSVIDNTTGTWSPLLAQSALDWSQASVADVVIGGKGKIKLTVRNGTFATSCAWITVQTNNGYLKTANLTLNDACTDPFSRQYIVCQELGHALGLGEARTDVPEIPSCMAPSRPGVTPNQEDFDQLAYLYSLQ